MCGAFFRTGKFNAKVREFTPSANHSSTLETYIIVVLTSDVLQTQRTQRKTLKTLCPLRPLY